MPQVLLVVAVGLLVAVLVVLVVLVAMRREIDSRARRTEAWLTLHSVLSFREPLPWPRPWAASPELLRVIVESLFEKRPKLVLELGSGVSTVVAAYALKRIGHGRIVSVDHEPEFADKTRALVAAHGLSDVVEVISAPLKEVHVGSARFHWYDLDVIRPLLREVDVLVVDGPPGKGSKLARYPALPLLREHLSRDAIVVVDDARRSDEQEMVRRWVAEDANLRAEYLLTEKGTFLVRRAS